MPHTYRGYSVPSIARVVRRRVRRRAVCGVTRRHGFFGFGAPEGEFAVHLLLDFVVYFVAKNGEHREQAPHAGQGDRGGEDDILHTAGDGRAHHVARYGDHQYAESHGQRRRDFGGHRQYGVVYALAALARLPLLVVNDIRRHDHRQVAVRAVHIADKEIHRPQHNESGQTATHGVSRGQGEIEDGAGGGDDEAVQGEDDKCLALPPLLIDEGHGDETDHRSYRRGKPRHPGGVGRGIQRLAPRQ